MANNKQRAPRIQWTDEMDELILRSPSNLLAGMKLGINPTTIGNRRAKLVEAGKLSVEVKRMSMKQVKRQLREEKLSGKWSGTIPTKIVKQVQEKNFRKEMKKKSRSENRSEIPSQRSASSTLQNGTLRLQVGDVILNFPQSLPITINGNEVTIGS